MGFNSGSKGLRSHQNRFLYLQKASRVQTPRAEVEGDISRSSAILCSVDRQLRRFGTYRSNFQGPRKQTMADLKMGTTGCPTMLVTTILRCVKSAVVRGRAGRPDHKHSTTVNKPQDDKL